MVGAKNDCVNPESKLVGWIKRPVGCLARCWHESGSLLCDVDDPDDLVEHLPDRTSWDDPKPKRREWKNACGLSWKDESLGMMFSYFYWNDGKGHIREVLPGDPDPEAVERLIDAVEEVVDRHYRGILSMKPGESPGIKSLRDALAAVRQSKK